MRFGTNRTRVKLWVDGKVVTRERQGASNTYVLDGEPYKAFGKSGVPAPIAEHLNLSDLTFARQLDGPFWFALSPPDVAKELNQLVDLALIDKAAAKAAHNIRLARTRVEVTESRLADAKADAEGLAWVEAAEAALAAVEAQQAEIGRLGSDINALSSLVGRAEHFEAAAQDTAPDTSHLDAALKAAQDAAKECKALESLIAKIERAEAELCQAKEAAKNAEAEFEGLAGTTCPTCGGSLKGR